VADTASDATLENPIKPPAKSTAKPAKKATAGTASLATGSAGTTASAPAESSETPEAPAPPPAPPAPAAPPAPTVRSLPRPQVEPEPIDLLEVAGGAAMARYAAPAAGIFGLLLLIFLLARRRSH
jgi:hypothetical protein